MIVCRNFKIGLKKKGEDCLMEVNDVCGECEMCEKCCRCREEDYSTMITKDNIDTWNDIVYGYILHGMMKENKDLQYGKAMTKAEKLTNLLFNALKFKMTCGIK